MYIGNLPPATRLPTCHYCGHVTDPSPAYGHTVCEPCDTRNIASDMYKEETGVRPRFVWNLRDMRRYVNTGRLYS